MKIKYKLKEGQISKYITTIHSLREAKEGNYSEKDESKMDMSMTQEVIKVYDNGTMDLKVTIDSSVLWKNGKKIRVKKKNRVFTMRMADNGEVLESSGSGPESPPLFPDRDVEPGDIWKTEKELSVPAKTDIIFLKTAYKFENFEKFKSLECVKIVINTEEVSLEFEEGVTQVIGGNGVTYFCPEEGKLIKSEIDTYTKTSLSGAEIKVTTRVVVRDEGDEKKSRPVADFFLSL